MLLRSFINRSFVESSSYVPTPKCNYAVNSVEIDGSEKFLVVSFMITIPKIFWSRKLSLELKSEKYRVLLTNSLFKLMQPDMEIILLR